MLFLAACLVPGIGLAWDGPGVGPFWSYGERVLDGEVPYRDFSVEYPPGSLPAFVVPALGPHGDFGGWFMAFEGLCGAGMVALVAVSLPALGARGARLYGPVAFAALAPLALGPLALQRYDLWAVLFVAAALAALLLGRTGGGFAALAAGTAAKLFPAVLVPLGLLRVGGARARTAAIAYASVGLAIVLPFVVLGPGGVWFSLRRQTGRGLQIETVGSSVLLVANKLGLYDARPRFGSGSWNLVGSVPDALAIVQTLVQVAAVVAVWLLYARSGRSASDLVLASAAALAVWMALGKVLSPQFLLWLLPAVALLAARRAAPAVLQLAALVLTQLVYPGRYDELVDLDAGPVALLATRNALLLILVGGLLLELQRQRVPQEVRREDEDEPAGEPVLLDGGERNGPDRVPRLQPGGRE